ncbi:hypothetical protein JCM10213_006781 [Rhodosporidiobolus nylandii]
MRATFAPLTSPATSYYGSLDERRLLRTPSEERLLTRRCTTPPLLVFSITLLATLLSAFVVHHFGFTRPSFAYIRPTATDDLGALKTRLFSLEQRVQALERRLLKAHGGAGQERPW